jgi:hypothetical protein
MTVNTNPEHSNKWKTSSSLYWSKPGFPFYGRFAHENILLARTSMHNILGGRKALLANGK